MTAALPRPASVHQERFSIPFSHPDPVPVAATGLITCVTNANMADSDYITIGDGINVPVLYEYDKSANGVTGGRVNWAAGAGSAATVAATLKTAIEATQKALTVTDNLDGTLTLTHKIPGSFANVTITENVANAGFLVSGMSGGANQAALTATATYKLFKSTREFVIDAVDYINPTGFVQDAANYWTVAIKTGSNTAFSWSTLTSAQGTLTADAVNALVASGTDTNRGGDAGVTVSLAVTKTAAGAAFPAGRGVVHGRWL